MKLKRELELELQIQRLNEIVRRYYSHLLNIKNNQLPIEATNLITAKFTRTFINNELVHIQSILKGYYDWSLSNNSPSMLISSPNRTKFDNGFSAKVRFLYNLIVNKAIKK